MHKCETFQNLFKLLKCLCDWSDPRGIQIKLLLDIYISNQWPS